MNEPQSVGDAGGQGFAGGTSTIHREGRRCLKTGSGGYVHVLGYVRKRVPGLVIRPGRASPGDKPGTTGPAAASLQSDR